VLPIGRPSALRAAMGVVAERGGPWQTATGGLVDLWIEVDTALPHGFSGGPLIDVDGRVVGLNTSALTPRGAVLPQVTVARVVARLLQHGTVAPGYLGAGFYPGSLPDEVAALAGQQEALMAVSLEPDGPAKTGGLAVGDAVLRLDGQSVTGLRHLLGMLAAKGAGTPVKLTVLRAGALLDLDVVLGTRPQRPRC
jgi:S1-C subfamily serine protease